MLISLSFLSTLLLLFILPIEGQNSPNNQKILLKDIETLTFQRGEYATSRRSSNPQQIQCQSGCIQDIPTQIQCYNMGYDGVDVNWKCDAELPKGTKFSKIYVECEGFDYPDDPYILRGSCCVVYSLTNDWYSTNSNSAGISLLLFVFIVIFICICCCLCGSWFKNTSPPQYVPVATAVDPSGIYPSAPPMPINPAYIPQSNYGYAPYRGGGGFLSGMGTGGVLGYMFGRSERGWGGGHSGGHHHHGSRSIPMTHQTGFARTHRR